MPIGEPTASNPIERRLLGLQIVAAACQRYLLRAIFWLHSDCCMSVEPCIVVMGVEVDGSIDLRAYASEESRL